MMTVLWGEVPTLYADLALSLESAMFAAIDRKGYIPCHMATATRNATITEVMGVACYSKADVGNG